MMICYSTPALYFLLSPPFASFFIVDFVFIILVCLLGFVIYFYCVVICVSYRCHVVYSDLVCLWCTVIAYYALVCCCVRILCFFFFLVYLPTLFFLLSPSPLGFCVLFIWLSCIFYFMLLVISSFSLCDFLLLFFCFFFLYCFTLFLYTLLFSLYFFYPM